MYDGIVDPALVSYRNINFANWWLTMSDIFICKHTNEEVSLIHIGKMETSKETVAIY